VAIPCVRNAVLSRRANARRGFFVLRRGQGLRPFPRTPFSASGALPPLRSGQVFLDEAEHLFHNQVASVAALRKPFAFGPECRSRSLRNQCSPSSESSRQVLLVKLPSGGFGQSNAKIAGLPAYKIVSFADSLSTTADWGDQRGPASTCSCLRRCDLCVPVCAPPAWASASAVCAPNGRSPPSCGQLRTD
jgi:hypothetical protein